MRRTEIDLVLAHTYFQVLVDLARTKGGETITYGELVRQAQAREPNNATIQRAAIATNVGRRLDALREFTAARGMPDLSALVVNKLTGDNGRAFKKIYDGEAIRAEIQAFDWRSVAVSFDKFIADQRAVLNAHKRVKQGDQRKRVPEAEARRLLWDFSKEHPEQTAGIDQYLKEAAVKLIMRGMSVPEAIKEALKAQ